MSFLLMIFLTLVCLFEEYPAPLWGGSPRLAVLLSAGALLLIALHAWWVASSVYWPLSRDPSLREALLPRYERGRFRHQFVLFVGYLLLLVLCGWGWAVQKGWRGESGGTWHGAEALLLLPFVLAQFLTAVFYYDADRAAHRAAYRMLDAGPVMSGSWLESRPAAAVVTPFGGRWSYVAFNLRQRLALVFIPVFLLIVQKELGRLVPTDWPYLQPILAGLSTLAMLTAFVCMPLLIRFALGLRPMPPGPLRDRLTASARRLGFRCSNLLVWDTRRGVANAMVVGLVPWVRYVVFTDRLLEEFHEDEVEAVFGHEIGHVRHQHMLFYMLFLTASMTALGLLADDFLLPLLGEWGEGLARWMPSVFPENLGALLGPNGSLSIFPVVLLLIGYILLVFGLLSRGCERQADVFGCRAVSCGAGLGCPGIHADDAELAVGRRGGLCTAGVRTFIRALEKVARVNGISRDRPGFLQSWQHSTIGRRVAFLHGLLLDGERSERRFQRGLLLVKGGLMAALGCVLAALTLGRLW